MARCRSFETETSDGRDLGTYVWFWCPGCKTHHSPRIRMPKDPTPKEIEDQRTNKHGLWTWNGDVDKPTFMPSILIPSLGCHSYVKDGKIQFLGDCIHHLKGQTVDIPEWKD